MRLPGERELNEKRSRQSSEESIQIKGWKWRKRCKGRLRRSARGAGRNQESALSEEQAQGQMWLRDKAIRTIKYPVDLALCDLSESYLCCGRGRNSIAKVCRMSRQEGRSHPLMDHEIGSEHICQHCDIEWKEWNGNCLHICMLRGQEREGGSIML